MVRLNVSAKGENKKSKKSTRLLNIEFKASKELTSAKILNK